MIQNELFEPDNENKQTFRLLAGNIVKTVACSIFSQNTALNCLAKSPSFFKELLNTFNYLHHNNISPKDFYNCCQNLETSQTDKERLYLIADVYQKYIETMQNNGYEIPYFKKRATKTFAKEIIFNIKNRHYIEFLDIKSEAQFVAENIKIVKEKNQCTYKDIAVFVDKTESRQKFLDIMKTLQIPVISSIYNKDYENLKHKINVFQKISEILQNLELKEFNAEEFKSAIQNQQSKAKKETYRENLDEILKSYIEEIIKDSNSLDKLIFKSENNPTKKSLLEIIYNSLNQNLFSEDDKETVIQELSALRTFYEFYLKNNYAEAICNIIKRNLKQFENTDLKDIIAGKIKSLNELQKLYNNILKEAKPDFESFREILEWLPPQKEKDNTPQDAVFLGSLSTDLKQEQKYQITYISCLTENNFPGTNPSYPFISEQTNKDLSKKIKEINPNFEYFLKTDEKYIQERLTYFADLIKHTENNLYLTTHTYEAQKYTQPSAIFKLVKDADIENYKKTEEIQKAKTTEKSDTISKQNPCNKQKIVDETDTLKINPSAISTFQQCPRKYFYKNLLNLKETSTFAASYGSIVHAVFEVLNRKYLQSYNKQTALELTEILFNTKNNEEKTLSKGFKQTDADLIKATDDLSLQEMKENFKNAIEDFEMCGYFDDVPNNSICEKSFSFTISQLPNVIFEGRIDAILTDAQNNNIVIDYKTGKNKLNSLDYTISEYGVNFKTKAGKDPSNIESLQNTYDYQIPIYYLACQNSKELLQYKDNIKQLGLLYIRPKSKHNGCKDDFINAEKIELYKDKIIQNIKETIVEKITNETEFKAQKGFNCENCTYKFLCDEVENDD